MERDDLIRDHEYSLLANHDEEHGKEIRKKIWVVTAILTAITVVEVIIGAFIKQYDSTGGDNSLWPYVKLGFIILTVVKAAYIVLIFMHLGDEKKNFKWVILGPYILFIIYLIFICLTEASYWNAVFGAPGSIAS
ncbi:MAG: cytochrome C oxidase subunit IV [Crocinitomicaceae bacterium]|nr:cytochrome C oxidase subunit IV [Crocinitomicaceae bacterium]|tara:strand:+ start:29122 stop:29526 length:405 start_codon:yes stop_codon:yes gene_type:complete